MSQNAENLARLFGLIISNTSIYGVDHAVTRQSVTSCFEALQAMDATQDVNILLSENGLTINGADIEPKNRLIQVFADHLAERDMSSLVLRQGLTTEQFEGFVEVLNAKPEELEQLGGVSGALAAVGLADQIATRKVTYREVSDEEIVVDKQALAKAAGIDGTAGEGGVSDEALKDFLRGQGSDDAADRVRSFHGDPQTLADLVIEASAEVSAADAADGEPMVAALRRVYQAMSADPSFHTQKTKKQIQRTLQQLESALLEKMRDAETAGGGDEAEAAIKEAIEEMTDELTLDALAQEYAKKRNAVSASEKRMLRYLKRKGEDALGDAELKQRLTESGLDESNWRELLAKSGLGSGPDGEGSVPGPMAIAAESGQALAGLLDHMVANVGQVASTAAADQAASSGARAVSDPGGDGDGHQDAVTVPVDVLEDDLRAVRDQVDSIVQQAGRRIEQLVEEVGSSPDGSDEDARPPRLTRKRLFEILAEIGQELCQPLSVINCSVDMVRTGSLGPVDEAQTEMLNAAADSGGKLKVLIDKLIAIAGTPEDFAVDKGIQASLYSS